MRWVFICRLKAHSNEIWPFIVRLTVRQRTFRARFYAETVCLRANYAAAFLLYLRKKVLREPHLFPRLQRLFLMLRLADFFRCTSSRKLYLLTYRKFCCMMSVPLSKKSMHCFSHVCMKLIMTSRFPVPCQTCCLRLSSSSHILMDVLGFQLFGRQKTINILWVSRYKISMFLYFS